MEHPEREQIEHVCKTNKEMKRLYERHRLFEVQIGIMGRRSFLTAKEQMELKRLKELKLRGVEKMLRMVSDMQMAA